MQFSGVEVHVSDASPALEALRYSHCAHVESNWFLSLTLPRSVRLRLSIKRQTTAALLTVQKTTLPNTSPGEP